MKTILSALLCVILTASSYSQQLYKAVEDGNIKKASQLLSQGIDVNEFTKEGMFPLWIAAANNDLAMVTLLINKGADTSLMTQELPYASSILDYPSQEGFTAMIKYLHEHGADIDAKGYLGTTPIIRAAGNGHLELVKYLVSQEADLDYSDEEGNFALGEAARYGHTQLVAWFVQHGAKINQRDWYGKTSYDLALGNGFIKTASYLRSLTSAQAGGTYR